MGRRSEEAMTTDTPSDLVKRLRALFIMDEANSDNPLGQEAADRIEELEKMLATESEVTLKFSEAIDRLERELAGCRHAVNTYISRIAELKSELAEAEKFRDYFERESVIWRKRAEKAERERDEALISALGMEYDENGWQDLARAALDMYGRKP